MFLWSGRNRSQCLSENATPDSQHRVLVSHDAGYKSPNRTASSFSKPLYLETSLRKIVSFEQWSKYEQTTAPDHMRRLVVTGNGLYIQMDHYCTVRSPEVFASHNGLTLFGSFSSKLKRPLKWLIADGPLMKTYY